MTDFVSSGRAQLATEVHGDGARTVLLIHAGVTDRRAWAPLLERLERLQHADGLRIVSYDARGFGETTYDPEPGWSAVADAVAVLDATSTEKAVVIGASMGGRTSIDLTLAHPERVDRLALIGSAVRGAPDPVLDDVTQALDEASEAAYERGDLEEQNRLDALMWLDGPHHPERVQGPVRDLFLEMNAIPLGAVEPGDQAETQENKDGAAWDRLEQIAVPTLVLVGEYDLSLMHDNARALADRVPDARLVEVPGVAHLPHLEGDETALSEIAEFVR